MAPSMQIDNVRVVNYEDLETQLKRASIEFTSAEVITFNGGSSNSIRLANLELPLQANDAANKQYVDSAILGLSFKQPVRLVSMVAGTLATGFAAGGLVDGVSLSAGDRILLMGQTSAIENGVYVVAASGAPTRSTDLASGFAAGGAYFFVNEGTVYKDRAYVCTSDKGMDVVGTHALVFVQFSSRSSAMAGHGLVTGAAEQLDVNVDDSTVTVLSDVVQVKDLGITNAKVANSTIENGKLRNPQLTVGISHGLTSSSETIALGGTATLGIDYTVVPDLAMVNTFSGAGNTFTGTVGVTGATTLGSTLAVTGATTLASTASISGTVTAPRLTGLADPSAPTDAVNLGFVTLAINNATQGGAARAVSKQGNVVLATLQAGSLVDGVTLADGDRVLVAAQTNGVENGVYVIHAAGTAPTRAPNLPAGAHAAALSLMVREGTSFGDRLFLCTNDSTADVVGTDALVFIYLAQDLSRTAGPAGTSTALQHVPASACLKVCTDDSTIEISAASNSLQLKNLGITDAKIAGATISNGKLVNNTVGVTTARGLAGGEVVSLGASCTLRPDFTILPDLAASNTFTGSLNQFQGGSVQVAGGGAATSQSTGALVVTGGVGISGDLYVTNSYNMSDRRLKTNLTPLTGALDVICNITGYQFTWNDQGPNQNCGRLGSDTVGVVAQEVQAAGAPLCVAEDANHWLAVDYTKLVPYLVESCKALRTEVDGLKEVMKSSNESTAKRARRKAPRTEGEVMQPSNKRARR